MNFHGHIPKLILLVILKAFKLTGGMIPEHFTKSKQDH